MSEERELYNRETAGSSGMPHVPRQPLENSESQRKDSPRFWFAAQYTEFDGYLRKLC